MKKLTILLLCTLTLGLLWGQKNASTKLQSHFAAYVSASDDSTRAAMLIKIAGVYRHSSLDSARFYIDKSKVLINKMSSDYLRSELCGLQGVIAGQNNEVLKAIDCYQNAIQIGLHAGNLNAVQRSTFNLGNMFLSKKEYDRALEYYFTAKTYIDESNPNPLFELLLHYNQGLCFAFQNEYDAAFEQVDSLKILEVEKDLSVLSLELSAKIWAEKGQLDSAIFYNRRIERELNNRSKLDQMRTFKDMSSVYRKKGAFLNAKIYAIKLYKGANELNSADYKKQALTELAEIEYGLDNAFVAYEHLAELNKIIEEIEYINREENTSQSLMRVEDMIWRYKTDEKAKLVNIEQNLMEEKRVWFISIMFCTVYALGLVLYLLYRQRRKKGKLVNLKDRMLRQQKNIHNSLRYAQRLQNSFINTQMSVHEKLPRSTFLHHSSERVSGTMLWVNQQEDKRILIMIDTRLSSIPGAFATAYLNDFLNNNFLAFCHLKAVNVRRRIQMEMSHSKQVFTKKASIAVVVQDMQTGAISSDNEGWKMLCKHGDCVSSIEQFCSSLNIRSSVFTDKLWLFNSSFEDTLRSYQEEVPEEFTQFAKEINGNQIKTAMARFKDYVADKDENSADVDMMFIAIEAA